mgnify:CR=1 FL=1
MPSLKGADLHVVPGGLPSHRALSETHRLLLQAQFAAAN